MPRFKSLLLLITACVLLLGGCAPSAPKPRQIIYRDWEGVIPQSVLDDFTQETGIQVIYQPYDYQEAVLEEIRAGQVYDVVVLENQLVQQAIRENLLAELHHHHLPNFKNISANFRDLVHDPKNAHTVPYSCGADALVVRTDLIHEPVTRWTDMWDARYQGKVIGWNSYRYVIGMALKSLGYSLNTEDPAELEAAKQRLLELSPHMQLVDWESAVSAPYLVSGEAVIALGGPDDMVVGREQNPNIAYIMPVEGAILWGDNWTIPANSPNQEAAEELINYLLRAEVAAQLINATYYWIPNDAALPLVDAEVRDNPAIFPSVEMLKNAEILVAVSPEADAIYQQVWDAFLATRQDP